VFKDDYENLRKAYDDAQEGSHEAVAQMHTYEKVVNDDLRVLARYTDRIANGNEAIIFMAGFVPTKTEITKAQAPAKGDVSAKPGSEMGAMVINITKLEFAIMYTFIIGKNLSGVSFNGQNIIIGNGAEQVYIVHDNKPAVEVKGLDTRVNYQIIAFGTSTAGRGIPSNIATGTTL
jgi:hypothetical protein